MDLIARWNEDIVKKINKSACQPMEAGKLNHKAQRKFDVVIDTFEASLKNSFVVEEKENAICTKTFQLTNVKYPMKIDIYYELKNMLLGRSYDLIMEGFIPREECNFLPLEEWELVLDYKGIISLKGASFSVRRGGAFANEIKKELNIPLIVDKVLRLGLVSMKICHGEGQEVSIRMESMKGSSTWCLIPPAFSLIPIKSQDCIDMVELLQLFTHGLHRANFTKA